MGSLITVHLGLADTRVCSILLGGAGMPGESGRDSRMSPEDEEAVFTATDPAEISQPDARRLRELLDLTGADRQALLAMRHAAPAAVPAIDLIAVPCLILTGEADDVVGSPQALAQFIPGARVELLPGDHVSVLANAVHSRSCPRDRGQDRDLGGKNAVAERHCV